MTAEALRAIVADPTQPQGRQVAAQMMLDGTDPDPRVRGVAAERLIDRLEGKPTQAHRVIDDGPPDVARVLADLRAELVGGGAELPALPEPRQDERTSSDDEG